MTDLLIGDLHRNNKKEKMPRNPRGIFYCRQYFFGQVSLKNNSETFSSWQKEEVGMSSPSAATGLEDGGRACRSFSEGGVAPPHGAFLFVRANKKKAKNGLL